MDLQRKGSVKKLVSAKNRVRKNTGQGLDAVEVKKWHAPPKEDRSRRERRSKKVNDQQCWFVIKETGHYIVANIYRNYVQILFLCTDGCTR